MEGVVGDGPRAPCALRDNPNGTGSEFGQLFGQAIWYHHPMSFLDHGDHLVAEKVDIFVGGFVGSSVDGGLDLLSSPWFRRKYHRGTAMLVLP
jgi:hypothetical protein